VIAGAEDVTTEGTETETLDGGLVAAVVVPGVTVPKLYVFAVRGVRIATIVGCPTLQSTSTLSPAFTPRDWGTIFAVTVRSATATSAVIAGLSTLTTLAEIRADD